MKKRIRCYTKMKIIKFRNKRSFIIRKMKNNQIQSISINLVINKISHYIIMITNIMTAKNKAHKIHRKIKIQHLECQ